jgi:hypothetical protein
VWLPTAVVVTAARDQKGYLGQIVLGRNRLQGPIAEEAIDRHYRRNDRRRLACEQSGGKGIDLGYRRTRRLAHQANRACGLLKLVKLGRKK